MASYKEARIKQLIETIEECVKDVKRTSERKILIYNHLGSRIVYPTEDLQEMIDQLILGNCVVIEGENFSFSFEEDDIENCASSMMEKAIQEMCDKKLLRINQLSQQLIELNNLETMEIDEDKSDGDDELTKVVLFSTDIY
jgi:hypothetical protein